MKLIGNNTTSTDQKIAIESLEYFTSLSDQIKKKNEKNNCCFLQIKHKS